MKQLVHFILLVLQVVISYIMSRDIRNCLVKSTVSYITIQKSIQCSLMAEWLGHLVRMRDSWLPCLGGYHKHDHGKRWRDVVKRDMEIGDGGWYSKV